MIGTDNTEQGRPFLHRGEQGRELGIHISQRGGLRFGRILRYILGENTARLMCGGNVQKQEQTLLGWLLLQRVQSAVDLVFCRKTIGYTKRFMPVAFLKQIWQCVS